MANSTKKQTEPAGGGSPAAPPVPGNMALWERWRHVDPECLKPIKGGHLNGKTDINPVWRQRVLTEVFGPCGIGWNVREVERWTDEAAGETMVSVKVELRVRVDGQWSEPIEGVGGSKLCGKGRGDGINDEAWKMATTDAISVACKALGIAADVYTGQQSHTDKSAGGWYGTKYDAGYDRQPQETPRNYPRSYRAGDDTAGGGYGQNRGYSGPRGGDYGQAPPPPPPVEYGPGPVVAATGEPVRAVPRAQQLPPEGGQGRKHVILATVTTGRCGKIIEALSRHDYDDAADWNGCIAQIRERYFVDDDALEEIQRRAVEMRNAALEASARTRRAAS